MSAGLRRAKIRIERLNTTTDDYGQSANTWQLIAERRAKVTPTTDIEKYVNSGEASFSKYSIELRYESAFADLSKKDRIIYSGLLLNIKSIVNPHLANRDLILVAEVNGS